MIRKVDHRRPEGEMNDAVLSNVDLVSLILKHVRLDPQTLVATGSVNRAWRTASHSDLALLMANLRFVE